MSGWDWLNAGLELATFVQAKNAQKHLAEMRGAGEIETARRALLEAMKSFIFDISRDIQLAEEQINIFPQQVYIVSKILETRLINSGLSADIFPDFQDKEYVFKIEKKIPDVIEKSKALLAQEQIKQSDVAIQYFNEMPILQQAISSKSSLESLSSTEKQWNKLNNIKVKKVIFIVLSIIGLVVSCILGGWGSFVLAIVSITQPSNASSGILLSILLFAACGILLIGSIISFVYGITQGSRDRSEFSPLEAERRMWQKQLVSAADWQRVIQTFGDLSSEQYQKIYDERVSYLSTVLGGGFHEKLISGE